jgi:hypothetical protein
MDANTTSNIPPASIFMCQRDDEQCIDDGMNTNINSNILPMSITYVPAGQAMFR